MMVTRYLIRVGEGANPKKRSVVSEHKTKAEAKARIKKILSKPKRRKNPRTGKWIYETQYRYAQSGTGLVNPRIIKVKVNR